MSRWQRLFLWLTAIAYAALVTMLGAGFTFAVEPGAAGHIGFIYGAWFVAGAAFSAPLWIPALLLRERRARSRWLRVVAAIGMVVPLVPVASIVVHQGALLGTAMFVPSVFAVAVVLTAACLAAMVLLIAPMLRARLESPAQ